MSSVVSTREPRKIVFEGDKLCALVDAKLAVHHELVTALRAIAGVLEAPTNRFGKPEFYTDAARAGRNAVQELARAYQVPPCKTVLEQAGKVARAAIAQATGGADS